MNSEGVPFLLGDRFPNGLLVQLGFLLRRQFRLLVRSPTPKTRVRFLVIAIQVGHFGLTLTCRVFGLCWWQFGRSLFLALLLGSMFFQLDNHQTAALNRFGLIFISLSAIAMGSSGAIPELFSLRRVFYLQRKAGYFHFVAFQVRQDVLIRE